jgi:uncharacterized protein YhaN
LGAAALVFAVLGSAVTPFFLLGLLIVGALAYGLWASGAATVSVADAEGQIRACCAALGLDQQQVDAAAVDRLLEELAGGFRQVQLWQEAQARCGRAQAAKDSAEATAQETRTKWQGLVRDSGFSAEPSPETVLSLLPTIAGVQQKLADAERLAAEIGKRESRLDVAWGKLLATGLLPDAPTAFSVEALDRVLARQAAAAGALASASRRTKELGKEVQTRDEEAKEALAALAARRKELATAEQEWRDWLAARGFQHTLTPATARDALDTVRDAWKHMQTLAALAEEQRRHERIIEEVNRAVGDLLKVLERQKGTQDVDTVIEALVEESAANDEKHVEAREKANRAVELEKKLERATEHEADCEKRLDEYLRAHGAESVEALREAISGAVRRQELQETCDRIFRALRSVLDTPDNDCVRTVFTSANYDVLADDLADREADLHEHETQREQARNERAEVRERLARLASSDDIARLRQEQESVRAEMDALAIEWARAALANRLLQEAKQTFEQERQPQVLREASTFFRLLTNDRYQGVFSPLGGERELRALLPDHDYRTPEQLSRGTVEQLYLALRFGFLADSADKGTALPVIMDEILVNFDPTRGKAAANAIGQLADTHQILYFTCHPSTAELLQEHANASLVHVRDGEFQPA